MLRSLAPLLLALLPACELFDGGTDCTLIGCLSQLTLNVEQGGEAVPEFSGEVTIDGTTIAVDCTSGAAAVNGVTCAPGQVIFDLGALEGGGDVTWRFSTPGGDTAGPHAGGNGTVTPEWSSSQPNGPECGPTCWSGEATVELFEAPAE